MLSFKKLFSKAVITLCLFNFLLLVNGNKVFSQNVDFSGDWRLNKEKTDFGRTSQNSTPVQLIIDRQTDKITIERFSHNSQGETHSYKEILSYDGKEAGVMIGSARKTVSVKWSANGDTLLLSARYQNDNAPEEYKDFKATEKWTLTADGGMLSIQRTDYRANGEEMESRIVVYDKLNGTSR